MKRLLKAWINKPAYWYEFWLPQSGLAGGTIAILLVLLIIKGICYV